MIESSPGHLLFLSWFTATLTSPSDMVHKQAHPGPRIHYQFQTLGLRACTLVTSSECSRYLMSFPDRSTTISTLLAALKAMLDFTIWWLCSTLNDLMSESPHPFFTASWSILSASSALSSHHYFCASSAFLDVNILTLSYSTCSIGSLGKDLHLNQCCCFCFQLMNHGTHP